jgi:DNA-binding protein H-NS
MPRKRKNPAKLSIEQLQTQLAQIEIDRKKLETALEKRRAADLSEFAATLRGQIQERGYRADVVIALLNGRKGAASRRRGTGRYVRYADPDKPRHTYVRGPLPRWFGAKMEEAGLDPRNKTHREQFKATHLKQVA